MQRPYRVLLRGSPIKIDTFLARFKEHHPHVIHNATHSVGECIGLCDDECVQQKIELAVATSLEKLQEFFGIHGKELCRCTIEISQEV